MPFASKEGKWRYAFQYLNFQLKYIMQKYFKLKPICRLELILLS